MLPSLNKILTKKIKISKKYLKTVSGVGAAYWHDYQILLVRVNLFDEKVLWRVSLISRKDNSEKGDMTKVYKLKKCLLSTSSYFYTVTIFVFHSGLEEGFWNIVSVFLKEMNSQADIFTGSYITIHGNCFSFIWDHFLLVSQKIAF